VPPISLSWVDQKKTREESPHDPKKNCSHSDRFRRHPPGGGDERATEVKERTKDVASENMPALRSPLMKSKRSEITKLPPPAQTIATGKGGSVRGENRMKVYSRWAMHQKGGRGTGFG